MSTCELAYTGATGGLLAVAAMSALALGALLLVAARRRKSTKLLTSTAALAVLVVGLVTTGIATSGSASAADCVPADRAAGATTDPSDPATTDPATTGPATPTDPATPTTDPSDPATTDPAAPTTDPTDPPTPTPPVAPTYQISGTYLKDGVGALFFTDPPGNYPDSPTQHGGTNWSLPTVAKETGPMVRAAVTLTHNGNVIATTTTDTNGRYVIDIDTPGDYVVAVAGLPTDHSGYWYFGIGPWGAGVEYEIGPWSQPVPKSVTVTDGDVQGLDFLTANSYRQGSYAE